MGEEADLKDNERPQHTPNDRIGGGNLLLGVGVRLLVLKPERNAFSPPFSFNSLDHYSYSPSTKALQTTWPLPSLVLFTSVIPHQTSSFNTCSNQTLKSAAAKILSLRATPGGLFANSQADGFVLKGLKAGRESRMLGGECLDSDKSKRTMLLLYCSSLTTCTSADSLTPALLLASIPMLTLSSPPSPMPPTSISTTTSSKLSPPLPPTPKLQSFFTINIQLASLRPDSYSFPFVLKAVTRFSSIQTGRQLHSQSIRFGLHSNLHVLTAFVQMYASFGSGCISDARKLFDGMSISSGDVALWNAMLNGYAKLGDLCNARDLFERMPQRNVISWTALITGYAQANRPHDAIALFRRMQLENVEPDEIAMLVALTACARLGSLELGEWVRHYIDRLGLLTKNIPLNNALIDMYAKSGDIKRALQVFENLNHKTVITWTTMIAGLALHGLGTEALEMFSRMERARHFEKESDALLDLG
ncbi:PENTATRICOPEPTIDE REPEAT-CONTAINING PROTEIN [Salix viminalis]|uniref:PENTATRICOPEPTIDE REPEAT-CONTAINING PROTEIN n=1 Tax=Salix viminalis TaxID=40686 RepID=A0A9Q0QA57_SALVM|nr:PENTATRICOPEPTIDE REPEAT-CONTAINING PROTEIN [Salix viminalis]